PTTSNLTPTFGLILTSMDSMPTLTNAFANLESTIKRLLTLVSGLKNRLAVLESGNMLMPVAMVASA
ncbi:hypothetical protein C0989_000439, partial [Termitomyces sp. Mn162]